MESIVLSKNYFKNFLLFGGAFHLYMFTHGPGFFREHGKFAISTEKHIYFPAGGSRGGHAASAGPGVTWPRIHN